MNEKVYKLIPKDRYITRKELIDILGISDRQLRREIAKIRLEHVIISLSSVKGYRRAKSTQEMTENELKEEYKIMKHAINENNSRIKKIKKTMRKQIAYLKKIEEKMREE